MKSRWLVSLILPLTSLVVACASPVALEAQGESEGESADALRSAVSCEETAVTGYKAGSPYSMSVITVGGKPTAKPTAHAFLKMQAAAEKAGVTLTISSGFRSMKEQQYFWSCYQTKKCNNGNLAARPGNSPHQNGRALDLAASNFNWLVNNASRYGFAKTVPSERWHYEYSGADPGGPCTGGAAPKEPSTDESDDTTSGTSTTPDTSTTPGTSTGTDTGTTPPAAGDQSDQETEPSTDDVPLPPARPAGASGAGCYSPTMGTTMEERSCVQSSADDVMYQCHDGLWYRNVVSGKGRYGVCTSIHEL